MARYLLPAVAALLTGCASASDVQVTQAGSGCPANHTLACRVTRGEGTDTVPRHCTCVRTRDLNSMLRPNGFGQGRAFGSRNRQ